MPGGKTKEQNSSLLVSRPLTPVVPFSTPPLPSAPTGVALTLSSLLSTPSPNSLFQYPVHSWLPPPHLLIHSFTLPFKITGPAPGQNTRACIHTCAYTHIIHFPGLEPMVQHSSLTPPNTLGPLPLRPLNSPGKTPTLIKSNYLPTIWPHSSTRNWAKKIKQSCCLFFSLKI